MRTYPSITSVWAVIVGESSRWASFPARSQAARSACRCSSVGKYRNMPLPSTGFDRALIICAADPKKW